MVVVVMMMMVTIVARRSKAYAAKEKEEEKGGGCCVRPSVDSSLFGHHHQPRPLHRHLPYPLLVLKVEYGLDLH
jgi:hypothetical protein